MKLIRRYSLFILLFSLLFFMGCSATITNNQAPVITSDPVTLVLIGKSYAYQVEAMDTKGDILTYSLTTKPSGMTINSSSGIITWTPTMAGTYNVSIVVSDGELFDSQSFTLTVAAIFT